MPNENKKRGRRAEAQKRKLDEDGEGGHHLDQTLKRHKADTPPDHLDPLSPAERPTHNLPYSGTEAGGNDTTFYGLLDEDDAEYFRRADNMLEANQFADPDQRALFLANVHKEADGKELKMACSQSCSRLFQRLLLLSTPAQLKHIFQKFNGHFLNLVQHRFASHCCETLFLQSAPIVTQELDGLAATAATSSDEGDVFVSMENLFLYAINEFAGNLGFLLTDRFASHTLRVLLLVLSGQPLDDPTQNTLVRSRKKETIEVPEQMRQESRHNDTAPRATPESFTTALDNLIQESIGGLDTTFLRALATHPLGNPALQSLLRLDLIHFGKTRAKDAGSIISKLIPLESLTEGTETAAFVNGLLYDPIGSRLLETVVEFAPGKLFKPLYRDFFRTRIGSLARNEISAYVVLKVLARLSADDLRPAADAILPQFPSLIDRGRTAVIKTLAERCVARGLDTAPVAAALRTACASEDGVSFSLLRLLRIPTQPTSNGAAHEDTPPSSDPANPTPTASTSVPPQSSAHAPSNPSMTLHASLLAQSLLLLPAPPLHTLIFDSLTYLEPPLYQMLATTPSTSHLLQTALLSPHATLIFRRKLISRYFGRAADLATHPAGSHLIDAVWRATVGLGFMRERFAEELAENEPRLRASPAGRKVWRNWKMDLYKRRRADWVRDTRREAGNDGFLSFPLDGDCERGVVDAGKSDAHARTRDGPGPSGAAAAMVKGAAAAAAAAAPHHGVTGIGGGSAGGTPSGKTGLQLARERYARTHSLRRETTTTTAGGGLAS